MLETSSSQRKRRWLSKISHPQTELEKIANLSCQLHGLTKAGDARTKAGKIGVK